MLLDGVQVVLVGTRFPENIGMAARACANMGSPSISLVNPERWLPEKAQPLATAKGMSVLNAIRVHTSLAAAVADSHLVIGTTARTGGWRKGILPANQIAPQVASALSKAQKVSLVFGPEDRGLGNADIMQCHMLLNIPTEQSASSLNVAQAVLLVLHECATAFRAKSNPSLQACVEEAQQITAEDMERLFTILRQTLLALDCLHGNNPEYFFLPWQHLLHRARLKRHEYDALMGLCRQIRHKIHADNV